MKIFILELKLVLLLILGIGILVEAIIPLPSETIQIKHIEFGASLGFPTNLKYYDGAIQSSIKQGIVHYRIYQPFIKQYDTNVTKVVEQIRYLINDKGATSVLICFNNTAYSKLSQDTTGRKFNKKQTTQMSFTNRCYPVDTAYHAYLLRKFCNALKTIPRYYKGYPVGSLLDKCEFELDGEPDAENHWWGTFDEWKRIIVVRYNALKDYHRPLYIADFTSSLMRDSAYKHKSIWTNYYLTDTMMKLVGFSNSMYWACDSANHSTSFDFNVLKNYYPNNTTSHIITEYNLYAGYDKQGKRDSVSNTKVYGVKLCEYLKFIYNTNISRIYIHPLCEFGTNLDATGEMGIWKKQYSQSSNQSYYTLKASGSYLYEIIGVIKDGYTIGNGFIKGTTKTINYNSTTYTITNN
jgi:hypothetical protein